MVLTKEQKSRTKLVRLRETTLASLKEVGNMHESYSDVIDRLLFQKKTGSDEEQTDTDKKIARLL